MLVKYTGAGNTFIVLTVEEAQSFLKKSDSISLEERIEFTKRVCAGVDGVSADGVLILEKGDADVDYVWDFYNSDGSSAEMCGNAARCAALHGYNILKKKNLRFKTLAGIIETEILGENLVRVRMPRVNVIDPKLELETKSSSKEKFFYLDTGVPHLVQKIHLMDDAPLLKDMAREIRMHQTLQPRGSNVTFYELISDTEISAITFERGVEDYTLACGTGAVAAAYVAGSEAGQSKINVKMPGGSLLIEFKNEEIYMTGSAKIVAEFELK